MKRAAGPRDGHFSGAPPRRARGQGLVEYGLILGFSGLLALGVLLFAGSTLADVLDLIAEAVDAAEGH